ncbi:hypothetical protein J7L49_04010, partial [Candidatus Bathyarchaeota archaeon]|nr:hypothetical protein [Candidatus Bathyarchaeota archaeon]
MKETLKKYIENLPTFELKEIAVKDGDRYIDTELRGVVEKGKPEVVYAVVGKNYSLIQFKDVFLPILDKIDRIKFGLVEYYRGKALVEFYPDGENFTTDGFRIGVILKNSVDKSWAINISFCMKSEDLPTIYLPNKIVKGLRKIHVGNAKVIVSDFSNVVGDLKEVWKTIVTKLSDHYIVRDEVDDLFKSVKVGKRIEKKIRKVMEQKAITLWDFFVIAIEEVSKRKYKNPLNKIRKLENISKAIFKYAL